MAFKRPAATLIACLLWQVIPALAATTLTTQPGWSQLTDNQRAVLAPLAREWNGFSDEGKLKWLGIADRYKSMTPVEQTRLQERMKGWASLSPAEREKARSQYLRLRTAPPDQRRALEQRWQEYDALPGDEKKRLKETRPAPPQPASSLPAAAPRQAPPKSVLLAPPSTKPAPIKPQ